MAAEPKWVRTDKLDRVTALQLESILITMHDLFIECNGPDPRFIRNHYDLMRSEKKLTIDLLEEERKNARRQTQTQPPAQP